MHHSTNAQSLTELVRRALQRDEDAWRSLVVRYERLVWKTVNMATSDERVREEAHATTWQALARSLASINDPERLPGWLVTTAVNNVRSIGRAAQARSAESLDELQAKGFVPAQMSDRDDVVTEDVRRMVRSAFQQLRPECRQLLTLVVMSDPPMAYADAAAELGWPIGSIGPNRQRCLDALRKSPVIRQLLREGVS